jgi:hypothetical protein
VPKTRRRDTRPSNRKVRYAVVGLGWFAQTAVLPAFAHARDRSELAALVSDDPKKLEKLGRKYRVDLLASYEDYPRCLAGGEIDAVRLPPFEKRRRPSMKQVVRRPPVPRAPEVVGAAAPSGN